MPLYNANLKPLSPGQSTHDYQHAAKLFLADNMRLAPKQTFLYYVCLNVNQSLLSGLIGSSISSQGLSDQYEAGMMVKTVDLPKFSIDTKVMNAYNRKTIVQNKINYDPITITFHDDAANVVLNFWNDYYTYYFRDSDYEPTLYGVPSTYDLRQRTKWGYSILNSNLQPFLRDIQIFSLNQKRFTEYRLVNPMITAWRHGEHNSAEGNGTMECTMTLSYETVKYRTGYVNPVDVNGFSLLHYDTTSSPIATSTTNIYTDQGVLGTINGGSKDLARPDGTIGSAGLVSNFLSVQRAYNNLKSVNWGSVAQKTLSQIGVNVVNSAINGAFSGIFVPTANSYYSGAAGGITAMSLSNLPGYSAGTTNSATGSFFGTNNMYPNGYQPGYTTSGGNLIDRATGAIVGKINAGTNSYFNLQPSTNNVVLGSDGQPVTGTTISQVLDPVSGSVVAEYQVNTTASGGYVTDDPSLNLTQIRSVESSDGTALTYRIYMNGDVLLSGSDGTSKYYPSTTATMGATPTTSAVNRPYSGATYAVNPFTGQMSLLNGVANRVISTPINAAINGVLTPVSNAIDRAVNTAINSVVTGIIDPVTGRIGQAIDGLTGDIKNLFGFSDPGQNPYLVCSIDGTVQSTFDTSYGLTYATDFTGEVIPIYSDTAMSSWTGSGQYYD